MAKILHILRYEIFTLVSRKSFWFGALGVPMLGFLVFAVIAWINTAQPADSSTIAGLTQIFTKPDDNRPFGYVDLAGLVSDLPEGLDEKRYIGYTNEALARKALDSGQIASYYVIEDGYIESGIVKVYSQEFDLISSQDRLNELEWIINFNLLNADDKFIQTIQAPLINLSQEDLSPSASPTRDRSSQMTFFVPYAVMMLFYVSIMGSSGLLLNSVTKEKENRVLEVLMLSADAQQLLLGKIVGLGLVGLFQVVIWVISSFALLKLSGQAFQLSSQYMLDPSIIGWGIIFFVLGYLVYAALMAGIGAMVPGLREASQATTIVVIPMMIPLFIISALIEQPNSLLSTVFSLFPLTSPTTMMLRLAATPDVPLWQILLAILLLIATDYLTIRAVAGLFRAQTMLSGQPFRFNRYVLALFGKL